MLTFFGAGVSPNPAMDTGFFTDTITAAILAAIASLLGLIISKESKVSEFRQKWIDELRKDVAWVLGEATLIHAGLLGVGPQRSSGEINRRLAGEFVSADGKRGQDGCQGSKARRHD